MQNNKPELLAPAGNFSSLKAAILGGCDAVYLGGKSFGARAFSNNFTNEELVEAICFAHLYEVKIYVTVNTLIYDNEVEELMEYIDFLHKNHVDAVIMQDIGMIDLVRQTYPNLVVHASTQMHIHNVEGVKLCEQLGIERVVLARETSYDLLKEIKKNTNMELEIFIHGALCISYSGQCLMSGLIGGRSGNRGSCAGSCRQKYNLIVDNKRVNKNDYLLSTKDLNTLENIGQLIDLGITSFKIEGRMKSPSYVYLVTKLYREAIDSYLETGKVNIDKNNVKKLMTIFNRMYTKGFLFENSGFDITNDERPNHLGVEIGNVIGYKKNYVDIKLTDSLHLQDGIRILGKEDVGFTVTQMFSNHNKLKDAKKNDIVSIFYEGNIEIGSKVVKTSDYAIQEEIDNLLKQSKRKVFINGAIEVYKDQLFKLTIMDDKNNVCIEGKPVEKAMSSPISKERIQEQVSKLGDTIFEFKEISIVGDEDIFISIKDINEYRRQAIELLLEKRKISVDYKKEKYCKELPDFKRKKEYTIELSTVEQYEMIKKYPFDKIYVEKNIDHFINDSRKIIKLDRVLESFEEYNQPLLIGELGSLHQYKEIMTDWSLNVVNSYTVAFLHGYGVKKITLSYELTKEQIDSLIEHYLQRYEVYPNLEIIIYGKEEAMISKFDLNKKYAVEKSYLEDRFHNLYPVISKNGFMHIYNYKNRIIPNVEEYYKIGINCFRMILLDETLEEIKNNLPFV